MAFKWIPIWLDALIFGYRSVQINGVEIGGPNTNLRAIVNFITSGASGDNPGNLSTDVLMGGGGGGGGQLPLGYVQGTSTVAAAVNERYQVTLTDGTPGNSVMTTDAYLTAQPGSVLAAVRTDGSGNTMTINAPTGGSIQDPTTRAFGSTASLNTQDQSASWYISGNVLRLF